MLGQIVLYCIHYLQITILLAQIHLLPYLTLLREEEKGLEISEAPRTTSLLLVVVAKGTLGNERGWNQAFLLCAWPISDVGQQELKACCANVAVTFIIVHFCFSKKLQTFLRKSHFTTFMLQNVNYI